MESTKTGDPDGGPGAHARNLTALHLNYQRPLQRYFGSFRLSEPDREDLIQELFVKLITSFQSVPLRNPDALVFTLARNLLRDRARRARARRSVVVEGVDLTDVPCAHPTPERMLDLREQLEVADAALDRLKPATRTAFLMQRIDGASHSMVARSLGVSVSMVEKHIMSASALIHQERSAR